MRILVDGSTIIDRLYPVTPVDLYFNALKCLGWQRRGRRGWEKHKVTSKCTTGFKLTHFHYNISWAVLERHLLKMVTIGHFQNFAKIWKKVAYLLLPSRSTSRIYIHIYVWGFFTNLGAETTSTCNSAAMIPWTIHGLNLSVQLLELIQTWNILAS